MRRMEGDVISTVEIGWICESSIECIFACLTDKIREKKREAKEAKPENLMSVARLGKPVRCSSLSQSLVSVRENPSARERKPKELPDNLSLFNQFKTEIHLFDRQKTQKSR
jgi:hypothetical protein